jgi:glycosyltransferase involved in cell wall biosynthesis
MVVTAVVAIRNEEAYLANCLRHLARNGIDFAIVDNGSTDASADIYRRGEFRANLVEVRHLPFDGTFSLVEQLRCKTEIIEQLATDWVIHVDADEIMHSYREGETLNDALTRVAAGGWNATNFDEFVFLPIEHDYVVDAHAPQALEHYYFFEPRSPRLMRAWQKSAGLTMIGHGGHLLSGPDLRLADERFALRHYLFRDQAHAFEKYPVRSFAPDELERGWHRARAGHPAHAFVFPPAAALKRIVPPNARALDRSEPWTQHFWQRTAPTR